MGAKSFYWIKLYYDLLDDWKVGNLPDSLKWRFIQCLLMAGELREGGFLPPLEKMAYRIRPITSEALNDDLSRLAKPGLVELRVHEDGSERWFVSKFEERQKPSEAAERMREYRKRKKEEKFPAPPKEEKEIKEEETDKITDIDNIPYRNASYTSVTNRNGTKENIYIHPEPEPIQEIITALSAISKTPYWPKTEEDYSAAAYTLVGYDATPKQVKGFASWWSENGYYDSKPALKSIMDSWSDYTSGFRPKAKKQAIPDEYKDIIKR